MHVAVLAPLGLLIALASTVVFTCSCGWLQPRGLPLLLAGLGLTVWTLLKVPARPYAPGFLAMLCTVLTSVLLANGVADVLLLNRHGAWLDIPPLYFAAVLLVVGVTMLVMLRLAQSVR